MIRLESIYIYIFDINIIYKSEIFNLICNSILFIQFVNELGKCFLIKIVDYKDLK